MSNLEGRVDLAIEEVRASSGTIGSEMEIVIEAVASSDKITLVNTDAELSFEFEDQIHVDGPLPQILESRVRKIGRGDTTLTAIVNFDRDSLEEIEEYRDGGDLTIVLEVWITGRRQKGGDIEVGQFTLKHELIDAAWSRLLDSWGYHDKRSAALDLEIPDPKANDVIESAYANISNAQRKHDQGDYPGAVVECRRAIEALRTLEDDLENVLDERKLSEVDSIMSTLETGFTGALSHSEDKTDVKTARKRDSDFALTITKGCAKYISDALSEQGEAGSSI